MKQIRDMTDEMVTQEIERLRDSEAVKLARAEQHYKYRERQKLYSLRWLEKRGNELMAQGVTRQQFLAREALLDAEDGDAYDE